MKHLSGLNSLNQLDAEQKHYILHFDGNLLTRVAEQTGKSITAVHLVYWGKTKYSPAIQAALETEIKKIIRRIRRRVPAGAPQFALTA